MTPEILPPEELPVLTGYKHLDKQTEWLTEHGVPHKVIGKRVLVARTHVLAWLEGRTITPSAGPNWSALNA